MTALLTILTTTDFTTRFYHTWKDPHII